jgi:uncharacterized protein YjbI with pentapeptide repeats
MSSLLKQFEIVKLETSELRNRHFQGTDFSNQTIPHLRAFDCEFSKCNFDEADLSDFRFWETRFTDCTFRKTNLRNAAIGGVNKGKLNYFERTDFSHADMRGIACPNANFTDCLFDCTQLEKVDFQGSRFIRCTFRGTLNETMFYAYAFRGESFPANTMEDVDFSAAKFRWVAFRNLNLDKVKFPNDENHMVLDNYANFLKVAVAELKDSTEVGLRQVLAVLENHLKWIGPKQIRGVISRNDFLECRPEAAEKFDKLIAKFGQISTE